MSSPQPAHPAADRNLLFGILALQMDFIRRDDLIAGMHAWVLDKTKPLGQILLEQGTLPEDAHALLEAMVQKHLHLHGDDPAQSLAAISAAGSVREQLHAIADAGVQATLAQLATGQWGADGSPALPLPSTVGESTSAGQRFRILRPHARGGLGQVYVALDEELHREVALKEIQPEHAGHAESRTRFLLEAQVTGRLEHPGIVPVYGLGTYADGRPFYAMRFIKGDSLQDAIQRFHETDAPGRDPGERHLELRKLLGRFLDVCNAIAYAHSRGILHRDLKPGNIMLGPYGETLVVDWGLAKVLGRPEGDGQAGESVFRLPAADSAETVAGSFLGTAAYSSPEQAAGRLEELGAASDVYSLGATLYALLTGKMPFGGADVGEVLRKVQRGDSPPPRQVKASVPAGLEAICLKAMALKPEDRYASPRLLADDLEHWLADEPVTAYREPLSARLGRWARQHKVLVSWAGAVAAVAATVLSAVLLVTAAQARERQEQLLRQDAEAQRSRAEQNEAEAGRQRQLAEQNQAEAEKQRGRAERYLYGSHMDLAQREWQAARVGRALELLEEHRTPKAGQEDLRGFEWHYLWRLCHSDLLTLKGHSNQVNSVAFSPDGKRLASGCWDGTVKLWDAATGQEIHTFRGHGHYVTSVAFSPDAKRLASAGHDRTVRLWDTATGQEVLTLKGHTDWVTSVAFSPDGKRLASGSNDGVVKLWDTATGQEVLTLKRHTSVVSSVAFSPNGKQLASGSHDNTVKLWDAATGQNVLTFKGHTNGFSSVVFSPDGKRLASGSHQAVKVWDAATSQELLTLKGHTDWVTSVAFSPDGKRLASANHDRTMKLWDAATGQELASLKGHTDKVSSVVFSPDGKRLASGSYDKTVKLWDAATKQEGLTLQGHTTRVLCVAFSPDGKRLASGSNDGVVKLWDTATGQEVLTLKRHTSSGLSVAFSPDGKRLASGCVDGTVKLWDSATGQEVLTLKGHARCWVMSVAFSPDGKRLASGSEDHTVKLWDASTGQEVLTLKGHGHVVASVAFSPDGKRLASGSLDGTVKLWDTATGREILTLKANLGVVLSVAFSPDGKRLASGSPDGTVKLWDAATGQELLTLKGHAIGVMSMAFSPDGKRLVLGSYDNTVKLWDSATGQELLTLKGHTDWVSSVAFSPDGKRLASGSKDRTVKLWETVPVAGEVLRKR
jgi:WD40 repeat protein